MRGGRIFGIGMALLLAARPAVAQDILYSDDATRACLTAAQDAVAQEACIGASANACMSANDLGGTTMGMGGCLDREYQYWDGLLNAYYQTAIARAKKMDAEVRAYTPEAAVAEQTLREMQRAWIPYRDAACDFERAQWGGGTGGGPAAVGCLMRMTGEQALSLGRFGYGQ